MKRTYNHSKDSVVTGKKFKMIANSTNHTLPLNTIFTFTRNFNSDSGMNGPAASERLDLNCVIWWRDVMLIGDPEDTYTRDSIATRLVELNTQQDKINQEIDSLKDLSELMKDNDLQTITPTELKVYKTLSIIENKKTSKLEKVKEISSLIDG